VSGSGSANLIRELARDLEPVRPIPRIRTVVAAVTAAWFAVTAVGLAVLGLRPDLVEATMSSGGVAAVLIGLLVAGFGSVVAALAMGVPGREWLTRSALAASVLGMAAAVGFGVMLVATTPPAAGGVPFRGDLTCLTVAMLTGLLPAAGMIWFAGRSEPLRPALLVLAAAVGAAALGALTAYVSCAHCDMRHFLVAHALAPAFGALVLTLPLLAALKRRADRCRS
jgi:hypothetical protein